MEGKYHLDPNLSGLTHLLFTVGLAFAGKSTRLNALVFSPIAALCTYIVFFCATDDRPADYIIANGVMGMLLQASDLVLLRKYQAEPRKIGQTKPTSEMTVMERLWWGATLCINSRGIGWMHEPTDHLPPRPKSSRVQFILSQLLWIGVYFLLFDVASILVRANPCFATGGPSLAAYGWPWRTMVWAYPFAAGCTLSMLYNAVSIVGVALRLSEPRDWPPLLGSIRQAYTVRNCWGRVWHQLLRKLFAGHTDFFAQVLHLRKGLIRTYFKLFASFFISGLLHYGSDYMLFQDWSGMSIRFFVLQAVAITFEDAVIALASRLGFNKPTAASKLLGYVWVIVWFAYSLPIWLDPIVHAGTMDNGINVSLILGIWRGDWTPKRMIM